MRNKIHGTQSNSRSEETTRTIRGVSLVFFVWLTLVAAFAIIVATSGNDSPAAPFGDWPCQEDEVISFIDRDSISFIDTDGVVLFRDASGDPLGCVHREIIVEEERR